MAASTGQSTKRYVSAINLLDKREIAKGVFDIWNESDFLDVMEQLGRSVPTIVPEYNLYTRDPLFVLGVINGTPSNSGTATITVTLSAGTSGYATINTLVKFPNGKVGRIDSITSTAPDVLVIKAIDGGVLTAADTNKLSFFSNAQGEASASPTARRYSQTQYSNLIQIFKDQAIITDVQMASQIETVGADGKPYWTSQAIADSYLSFRSQIALAMIMGRKGVTKFSDASPSIVDASSSPIQTTMGLDSYCSTYGISDVLTTPGTPILADLEDLVNQIKAVRGSTSYFAWSGSAPKMKYDTLLKNLGSANVQWSMRYQMNGKDVDFTVDSFNFGGVKFDFKVLDIFDHPQTVNYSGAADINKSMYFIPSDKIMTMAGDKVDRLRIRTMKVGGMNDKGNSVYSEVHTGKLAENPTDDTSVLKVHFESKQGLEACGVQHFAKQVVLA